MNISVKVIFPEWMVEALDNARVGPSPIPGRVTINSRAEMIRKFVADGLKAREAAKPVAQKIAESKKRTAESREARQPPRQRRRA